MALVALGIAANTEEAVAGRLVAALISAPAGTLLGAEPTRTFVELMSADIIDPSAVAPAPPVADPSRSALEADQTAHTLRPSAPAQGQSPLYAAPAPDRGEGDGKTLPTAFRRDVSTLRARLSDGARTYQPSHDRTGRSAASPQAARQEPIVGTGDSVRTQRPRPTEPRPPTTTLPAEADDTDRDEPVASARGALSVDTGRDRARGEGPLDTDEGRRSYDVEALGRPGDNVALRAASNEAHPGPADYTAAAAPGPRESAAGRGPAPQPGAVARPAGGTAAALPGVPVPVERGPETELETLERLYAREYQEIGRRVKHVLVFPKRLMLLLEQGEAIVAFDLDAGGRLVSDVKVLKSAGFLEFDAEAVSAVRRAAPFPRMRRGLHVRLRLSFDNPVIR